LAHTHTRSRAALRARASLLRWHSSLLSPNPTNGVVLGLRSCSKEPGSIAAHTWISAEGAEKGPERVDLEREHHARQAAHAPRPVRHLRDPAESGMCLMQF
ncbi:hypothetical protein PDJAM_G00083390, partial [Pangasius djambal]|nr:hypothetical protein [Pangasius djambal]